MFKIDSYSANRILKVVTLGLMVSIIFSFKLWTSDREFLTFPIFEWFRIPIWLEYGLLGIFLIALLFIIIGINREKLATRIVLILLLLLICLDQMRLQPWSYFFGLLLLPFSLSVESRVIINYYRYLFVILYIWSGIHKINPYFETLIFQDIWIHILGDENSSSFYGFSMIVPVVEILAGVFLCFNRTLKLGIYLALVIHLSIIYFIVFIVYGNFVILPWNMTIIFLLMVFGRQIEAFNTPRVESKVLASVLILTLVLPFGYIFGNLDQSLSFSLYDGKVNEIYMVSSEEEYIDEYHQYIFEDFIEEGTVISFSLLSHEELKVPFYPEKRFLERLKGFYLGKDNHRLIQMKLPLWKINSYSNIDPETEKGLFGNEPLPFIQLKDSLLIPKYELISD